MHFLFLLLLIFVPFLGIGQVDYTADSPYRKHVEGEVAWTLYQETKVYWGPDTQALLYATLPVGTALTIVERLDEAEKRQGFFTNWYRAAYQGQEIFVWGGDLAVAKQQNVTTGLTILYGLKQIRMVERGTYQEPQLELVVVAYRQGEWIDSIHLAAIGTLYTLTNLQLRGNQGLAGIQEIVEIAFSDGYCGGVAATATLLWNGQNWTKLAILSQGFGDNHFSNAYYQYPQEHQTGSNIIELHREKGYYNQERQAIYTQQNIQIFEWTGKQLLLIDGG
ncbi:MAG: hypothetical protein AB8E82_08690 [Aureispira sp.]